MIDLKKLNKYRTDDKKNDNYGSFKIFINGRAFIVVATREYHPEDNLIVEHISVSLKNGKRTPTWDEMCYVKDMFFDKEDECIQIHPKQSEYVNVHPYCLHIWHYPHSVPEIRRKAMDYGLYTAWTIMFAALRTELGYTDEELQEIFDSCEYKADSIRKGFCSVDDWAEENRQHGIEVGKEVLHP